MDDANRELINNPLKPGIKQRPTGKCTLARKRLKHVFNMRKYYLSIIGLTGFEVILVLCRIILEIESLRLPPGNAQRLIHEGQLALECLSLFTLLLFIIEVPLKLWTMETILNKSKQTMKQLQDLQQAYNEADQRINQLESILQEQTNSKDYPRSLSENKQNQPIQQTRPMSKVTYSNYPGQR
ncbi:hypothetical protein MN116_004603 [Schistosoma mekongi]|uniref:Uncharacterized protein n=1 Tax=Schistosoma mekongi TaxID=38744 RepID=A0AAE1ZDK8_SCHME|nr:hypothetical protein MN116_004603 [Schistosoma mekongi]